MSTFPPRGWYVLRRPWDVDAGGARSGPLVRPQPAAAGVLPQVMVDREGIQPEQQCLRTTQGPVRTEMAPFTERNEPRTRGHVAPCVAERERGDREVGEEVDALEVRCSMAS